MAVEETETRLLLSASLDLKLNETQNQPSECLLVTLDVTALYTNIPQEEGMEACREAFNIPGMSPILQQMTLYI